MWGLVKGVKIGLRFALQGLVFEIEAIFEDTLTKDITEIIKNGKTAKNDGRNGFN